ncbi:MAG TPA: hypothetical protein PK668_27225 [Myxococcota bacterium]|nr:hypothetical protein [Myxococcota bacterium]HRY97219.1 hypothetical protein [Myxococcota bacterium]HSA20654.1 hypothetical protein [Myxococcota bacterium]
MRVFAAPVVAALALLLLVEGSSRATTPHSSRRFHGTSGKVEVRLNPTAREGALEIFRAAPPEPIKLGLKELSADLERRWGRRLTTAGTHWYRNAMGFISQDERYFFLRSDSGEIVVLDLGRGRVAVTPPKEPLAEATRWFRTRAVELLASKEPVERETGALAVGQMNIREAIPALRTLLQDDSYVSVYPSEGKPHREYYVRQAAKAALEAMGEQVTGVETQVEFEER